MSKSQLIYSSHRKPCPICERTKDQDCRWNDDVVLCHTYIDKDAAISGYIYRGATDDGLWGQYFPIIEEPSNKKSYYPSASTKAEELSKPIRANSRKEFYYPDAQGDKLVKVVRTDSGDGQKKFAQYHWNGKEWEAKLTDEAKAKIHLYRIHEAINQDAIADGKPILKVEGEGKVDSLIKMGIPATCSIGGSGAWRRYGYPNYLEDLKGASVVLCPDQDVVGIKHCEEIAQDFPDTEWLYAFPDSVKWNNLPKNQGLDIADWIDQGVTKEEILAAIGNKHEVVTDQKNSDKEPEEEEEKPKPKTTTELLMAIASQATYFHTENEVAYADIYVNGHRETYPVRSQGFKKWLSYQLYIQYGKVAGGETLNTVLLSLEAKAQFQGEKYSVYLRVAEAGDKIYLDLGTSDWTAVEISAKGWQIVSEYPVRFRRSSNQLPLPTPVEGGDILELKQILNFNDADWILVLSWLTFCFYPKYPHPILILHGEQGSGKSFASRILKSLVDPTKSPLQPEPRDLKDLSISANNRWLLAFDNLSDINNSISDTLCRIATGGGFSTRTLYENDQETVFEFMRPLLINGIDSLATRSDLLERSILVNLPTIQEDKRLTEDELQARQETIMPRILGALLTAVSKALRSLPEVKPKHLPRMADFAKWAVAIEEPLGFEPGDFMKAYEGNRQIAHETALEVSPVAIAIQRLMDFDESWKGTATELLPELEKHIDEKISKSRSWPGTSKALGKALVRIIPNLRGVGIQVVSYKGTAGKRLISLEKIGI